MKNRVIRTLKSLSQAVGNTIGMEEITKLGVFVFERERETYGLLL